MSTEPSSVEISNEKSKSLEPPLPEVLLTGSAGESEKGVVREEGEGGEEVCDSLRAWVVLFGAVCMSFSTFGYVNAWGVFQSYYQETLLAGTSPSTISWIGSLEYSLLFCTSIFVTQLFENFRFRIPFVFFSVLLILSVFLTAQCSRYWQFLICQGILSGVSSGAFYGPLLDLLASWFDKHRGLAFGLFTAGASTGGTVTPIIIKNALPKLGFAWTLRVLGFIYLCLVLVANLVVRNDTARTKKRSINFSLSPFKSTHFVLYCLSILLIYLALEIYGYYVAITAGLSGISDFAFYLVSIANASCGVGRLTSGWMADRAGEYDIMIIYTIVNAMTNYAWPFAHTKASLIVLTIVYGYSAGAFTCLLAAPLVDKDGIGKSGDSGLLIGLVMIVMAIASLVAAPIAGLVYQSFGLKIIGMYTGNMLLLGVCVMSLTRYLVLRRRVWGKA
ncbi:MFS general substrate transporter [Dendrothele bispora CBS 962.96]|uniref:MFS general substrate transporter n=1 Tax=Dendrothele bispora (strain CBS 962.96) TaxID=1314807 RepID=A0A4S8L790_DENBC|nr:MFS general substrate transporter [Dendrothele bispora CBS 962.96]